jgi:hypothetical protein
LRPGEEVPIVRALGVSQFWFRLRHDDMT